MAKQMIEASFIPRSLWASRVLVEEQSRAERNDRIMALWMSQELDATEIALMKAGIAAVAKPVVGPDGHTRDAFPPRKFKPQPKITHNHPM